MDMPCTWTAVPNTENMLSLEYIVVGNPILLAYVVTKNTFLLDYLVSENPLWLECPVSWFAASLQKEKEEKG